MKTIKSLLTFGLSAVTALTITSCQDFDFMDEAEIKHDLTINEYTQNFIAQYGNIDPNHTWGFVNVDLASTRANVANKNQWDDPNQKGTGDYIADRVRIPGWPDNYQKQNSNGTITSETNGYHYGDNTFAYSTTKPNGNPCGDVTDEEIQYVSWWFRTHYNPGGTQVHFSDFFIQEISSDVDRNADGTMNNNVPVKKYNSNGELYQTDDVLLSFEIDQLEVKTFDGNGVGVENAKQGYDHIYNFNAGKSNKLSTFETLPMAESGIYTNNTYSVRNIGFYTTSGTEDFDAHYSNDGVWRDSNRDIWRMVHLKWIGKSGRLYDGWYIGFDYAFYSRTDTDSGYMIQERVADKYYSNWILKLTPAEPIPENYPNTQRVMCEDLGNTYDFDFNDVVFDVTYNFNDVATKTSPADADIEVFINILAAGGTMPIYVGVDPRESGSEKYEAHHLLGHNSKTPVNVGGEEHAAANYRLKGNFTNNPASIPVYVVKDGNVQKLTVNNLENYTGSQNNNHTDIVNGSSSAPQKFAVPNSVQWMKETIFIERGYDLFPEWVKNESEYGHGSSNPWYEHINNASLIHKYVAPSTPTQADPIDEPILDEDPDTKQDIIVNKEENNSYIISFASSLFSKENIQNINIVFDVPSGKEIQVQVRGNKYTEVDGNLGFSKSETLNTDSKKTFTINSADEKFSDAIKLCKMGEIKLYINYTTCDNITADMITLTCN